MSESGKRTPPALAPIVIIGLILLFFNPIKNWFGGDSQNSQPDALQNSRTSESKKFMQEGRETGQIHRYWLSYVYANPGSQEEREAYNALTRTATAEVLPYIQEDLEDDKDYFWRKPHKVEWPAFKQLYDLCGTQHGIDWSDNFVTEFSNDFMRGFRTGKTTVKGLDQLIKEQRELEQKKAKVCKKL